MYIFNGHFEINTEVPENPEKSRETLNLNLI